MLCCLGSSCLFYVALTLLIIYFIYKLTTRNFNLDQQFQLKGPKPLPIVGNLLEFIKYGFHVCDIENQKKYGHIYPVYMGQLGMIVVSDEDILRQLLVKDFKSFTDRPIIRGGAKLMKKNLLQLKGKDWERVRALVTPVFTSGKLKKMSPMINASVTEMLHRFKSAENSDIDAKEIFGSLTMEVIAKTMFGIEIDVSSNSSHAFLKHAKKLFNISVSNVLFAIITIIPQLAYIIEYLFPRGTISGESILFFEKSLALTIKSRRNNKEEYHDFLSLMLKAHDEIIKDEKDNDNKMEIKSYKGLTEEEMMAQSIVFLLAGYETTASALTFCSYYLAKNPGIQDEIYQELLDNLSDKQEISYDMLSNLNLLEQCLNETLRICPPASRFGRVCTKDVSLTSSTGQVIRAKKGMTFIVPVYAIHHDERIWPDPDTFDIHRFDPEEKQKRSLFSFMPFGNGPRNCIGMRFALLEAKLALACLLKTYRILPCDKTPDKLTFGPSGLTKTKESVIIRIEKR